MTTAHICIMAAIIVYLGAMIFVGYLCSKNNNDSSDFYLGGRKLGPLVTAIGTYVNWRIVAKRIRRYTHVAGNSITLPSFFSNRYRDEKKILQSIGAIFIVIFFIPYTASGFAACGKLFASLFGVKYLPAMIISIGYRWLYYTGRIPGSIYYRLYPEYHHVHRTCDRIRIRDQHCRWY